MRRMEGMGIAPLWDTGPPLGLPNPLGIKDA